METEPDRHECDAVFRDFLLAVEPIAMREPLAAALGAFTQTGSDLGSGSEQRDVVEYRFTDAVKLAGHCCPTVAGAFLVCREGLRALYPDQTPVRGEISVTVFGAADEGGYGAISQILSLITGAAAATGFKGLAGKFVRKDLLKFAAEKPDPGALSFEFRRNDNGRAVLVKFYPWAVPFPEEKGRRSGELLPLVASGQASTQERLEFQGLWMEKVRTIIERNEISNWLKIQER